MSDIRTFRVANDTSYEKIASLAEKAAADAANVLKRVTVGIYNPCRTTILPTEWTAAKLYGKPVSRPGFLSGWSLKTRPFFLCDPTTEFPGALFIQLTNGSGMGEVIDEEFVQRELLLFPVEEVLPTVKLLDVHTELLTIIRHR